MGHFASPLTSSGQECECRVPSTAAPQPYWQPNKITKTSCRERLYYCHFTGWKNQGKNRAWKQGVPSQPIAEHLAPSLRVWLWSGVESRAWEETVGLAYQAPFALGATKNPCPSAKHVTVPSSLTVFLHPHPSLLRARSHWLLQDLHATWNLL